MIEFDVKSEREEAGLTRSELARRVGVSSFEIAFYERRRMVSSAMHSKIKSVCASTPRPVAGANALLDRLKADLSANLAQKGAAADRPTPADDA